MFSRLSIFLLYLPNFGMTNAQIADAFDLIGDLLEFQGANPFRVRAYRNSARTIRDYSESLASVVADNKNKLTEIEGIGDELAKKIVAMVETGDIPALAELRAQVPQSVLALLRIPGVGPKKAAALHKELGIVSLDQLRAACEEHKVRDLKGFGEKTEQIILAGIGMAETASLRMLWAEADTLAQSLRVHFKDCPGVQQFEFGGSYRRGKDTVGDLDILVVAADPTTTMDRLASFEQTKETLARGDTKMSIRTHAGFQVDLRVVPAESFGAALQYFTGSKDHNVVVRGMAKAKGLKINEWGVFKIDGPKETYVAGRTEADVYATLGLPAFPPELREARKEFDWAQKNELPELITVEDIRGDLHMHTHATDGSASIEEMAAAAFARGLAYIAITDHSQRVSMANGLTPQRALEQWKEIDRINLDQPSGFRILKGIECDVLEKGGMDLPDDVLAEADWVIASIHYGQKQPRAQITERMLGAIANPHVDQIAHPTGRLLNRREAYEIDIDAVFAAAKQHGKLLELNANPMRLDLSDTHLIAAKQHGIPIVINTDAHSTDGLSVLRYGILQARRAGLTKADVANTRTWGKMKKLVGRKD
jgi:DNA polymerase (family 10)